MTPKSVGWRAPGMSRRSAASLLSAVALGLLLAAWHLRIPPGYSTPVRFVSYGAALVLEDAQVWSAPGGGRSLGRVAAGTRLGVGGRAAVSSGLWRVDAFWISLDSPEGPVQGFIPASAVVLIAGSAPSLDLSGIDPAAMLLAPRSSSSRIAWLPDAVSRWDPLFEDAGTRHGVDPDLLAIVALVESGGRPDVTSSAGAIGLMQVMPATAGDIARWRGLTVDLPDALRDPALNIDFGSYYLARNMRLFGDEEVAASENAVARAAAAYNGGPGAAQRWMAGGNLPAETVAYQTYVVGMWQERAMARSAMFERWCSAGGRRLVPPPHCPS